MPPGPEPGRGAAASVRGDLGPLQAQASSVVRQGCYGDETSVGVARAPSPPSPAPVERVLATLVRPCPTDRRAGRSRSVARPGHRDVDSERAGNRSRLDKARPRLTLRSGRQQIAGPMSRAKEWGVRDDNGESALGGAALAEPSSNDYACTPSDAAGAACGRPLPRGDPLARAPGDRHLKRSETNEPDRERRRRRRSRTACRAALALADGICARRTLDRPTRD
jgi:hypothetical protein